MITRRYFTLAVVFWLCACASGQGADVPRGSRDMSVLTGEELLGQGGTTVYDQIRRVRPNWLRVRGASPSQGGDAIIVYRDGVRQGGLSVLQDYTVESVQLVQFLTGPEAAARFGLDHQNGAILVTTRRR